ncbi:MAG: NlpC/P60 family protein [Actinomycetota bacterium]
MLHARLKSASVSAEALQMGPPQTPRFRRPLRRALHLVAFALAALVATGVFTPGVAAAGAFDLTAGDEGSGPPAPVSVVDPSVYARGSRIKWADVRSGYWARTAIDYVGKHNNWMRDYPEQRNGETPFKPNKLEPRKLFLRAAVRAFAPDERPDPDIVFDDLPKSSNLWDFASVAVKLGWIERSGGKIRPDDAVSMQVVHQVLTTALGLRGPVNGIDRLETANGIGFKTTKYTGSTLIGMRIGLRYNHGNERDDVTPKSKLPRSEVAWSLYRAATVASWTLDAMDAYTNLTLPSMSTERAKIVRWGLRYAGYPYIWGGEWHRRTRSGYCCGAQPTGGFDCSGLTWWVIKRSGSGWDPTPPRSYRGWDLAQRSSADMARATRNRVGWKNKKVGDLLLYDGNRDGTVDHVNVYAGKGFAVDSSSSAGGVSLMWVGNGWYRDHFKYARRVVK